MRAIVLALAVAVVTLGARADNLPNPAACATFTQNKTGGDPDCDAAIAKEIDPAAKSVLLYRRAFMIIDRRDAKTYPKALEDLAEAIRLLPTNYHALHERAYVYNEQGRWAEALKDLDTRIALMPQEYHGYQERALTRFHLGDLAGHYDDRNAVASMRPKAAGALIARADAAAWLGQFNDARKDLRNATALGPTVDEESQIDSAYRDLTVLTKTSTTGAAACSDTNVTNDAAKDTFVGDCTLKFLQAATDKAKAGALTLRSIGWLTYGNERAARQDNIVAAGLDPDNAETHANLAFAIMRDHHYAGAISEFDRSIALKPTFAAYAGRAEAKFVLNDIDGAFADAKKSIDMEPNVVALMVMGDLLYTKYKSYDQAKPFWIAAYHLGSRSDYLIGRLKDAGVPIPPPEEPKK